MGDTLDMNLVCIHAQQRLKSVT